MTVEERVLRLENAFAALVELAWTQSERMDEYERRTEELAEAQKQTQAHLSTLAMIVGDLGRAQTRTEQALFNLTEKFDRYLGEQR